jgi:hypothetical protein
VQIASALDAAKTRLRNQIKDLEKRIAGEPAAPRRPGLDYESAVESVFGSQQHHCFRQKIHGQSNERYCQR